MRKLAALLLGGVVVASLSGLAQPASAAPAGGLDGAFTAAGAEYQVPRDLLAAVAYSESGFDGHQGQPSASNGYGVMHLVSNPSATSLDRASVLTGVSVVTLQKDTTANIRGGAAVLRAYADEAGLTPADRQDINKWYPVVARYGNAADAPTARLYADTVYEALGTGIRDAAHVTPRTVAPQRGELAGVAPLGELMSSDYGPAKWSAAHSNNYATGRGGNSIKYVVIHVTQGSYAGSISWFKNGSAKVSAHYVIKSSNGEVTQMVRNKDTAWHAGNSTYNKQSIGIEHEGFVNEAKWFTNAMYKSSAALTKAMCNKYGIPKTRSRIIGHNQVPGATHSDPGRHWNWTTYMRYVTA
ncbi:N-acetylmuramoyl-L-alanine amidase [Longispora albida]|uniref:N-acetylmuramoyl-L-alanine amidase n=1 Tax=Longispora albida TaxID=203523 RepID=UPI00036F28D3|nr:N-acetylmuramoyl-L-alanine amidase [Longispora albida]